MTDFIQGLTDWWRRLPSGCTTLSLVILALHFVSYLVPELPGSLVDVPYDVFFKGEGETYSVYRLVTAAFMSHDLLWCLMSLCLFLSCAPEVERHKGTTNYIRDFFILNTLMHLLSGAIVVAICSSTHSTLDLKPSYGLLPIVLLDAAFLAGVRPDSIDSCCGVKNRCLVVLYLIVFLLLTPKAFVILLCALLLGTLRKSYSEASKYRG
jgi:membrane associated rhomboid family serine protease